MSLRAWNIPDVPYIEAVSKTLGPHAHLTKELRVFEPPLEVEVHPDLQQPNQILEWGIINPSGPTICQLAVVEVAAARYALVWTLHHFPLPQCFALAVGPLDEPEMLREVLAGVFAANGPAKNLLFKSLPHWVRLPEDSSLDVDTVAALVGSAHRRYLEFEDLRGEHPDAALAGLWRLAKDPIAECRRQEERAFEDYGPVMKALSAGDNEAAAALLRGLVEAASDR